MGCRQQRHKPIVQFVSFARYVNYDNTGCRTLCWRNTNCTKRLWRDEFICFATYQLPDNKDTPGLRVIWRLHHSDTQAIVTSDLDLINQAPKNTQAIVTPSELSVINAKITPRICQNMVRHQLAKLFNSLSQMKKQLDVWRVRSSSCSHYGAVARLEQKQQ